MSRLRLDQAAIALSGLCMIHCVASVAGLFAIGLLSVVGGVDELFHQALLALIALCLLTAFEAALHDTLWEPLLTSLVGICLVATHVGNIRACKECESHHEEIRTA
jgi:hypothetical protein